MELCKLRHKVIVFIVIILMNLLFLFNATTEAGERTVELDAERITYDDISGIATAEGNAILSYGDVRILAERIDYNDDAGKVVASSIPDKGVVLSNGRQAVRGDQLLYDINTSEGILTGAKSTVIVDGKPVFIRGENLEAIPYDLAVERKLISGKSSFDGDYVIKWDNVSITTCNLEHPHYRLEARRFIFTPQHRVVVKRPRLYLGEKYIFTYPFDYIINVNRQKSIETGIFPTIAYQSSKGTGIGFSGPIAWESGAINFGLLYWSDIGLEWNVALEQKIGRDFTFRGELDYSWDRMWDDNKYRPDFSFRYDQPLWFVQLNWSRNQYLEMQKNADYQYRGQLDSEPEIIIGSPWLQESGGWYRVSAMWGKYRSSTVLDSGIEETEPWRSRYKLAAETYYETRIDQVTPFLVLNAEMMFYEEDKRQDVISAIFGLRYDIGNFKLGTAYARNWVSGETTMSWDQEFENEIIYQMLEIPLGKYFSLGILGGYDLKSSFLEEMNYTLRYLNDCMLWELTYRNDRNFGGENKVYFSIGFTGTSVEVKNKEIYDPFVSPVSQNSIK